MFEYYDIVVCPNCKGDRYEPSESYEMTCMDYHLGPRICSLCYGTGKYSQMAEDEYFDRLCK